jgi:hypothetical protein
MEARIVVVVLVSGQLFSGRISITVLLANLNAAVETDETSIDDRFRHDAGGRVLARLLASGLRRGD